MQSLLKAGPLLLVALLPGCGSERQRAPLEWEAMRDMVTEACSDAAGSYADFRDDFISEDQALADLLEAMASANRASALIAGSDPPIPYEEMEDIQPSAIAAQIGALHDHLTDGSYLSAGETYAALSSGCISARSATWD